ncbi:MAG: DUF1013 domain-containing protein [Alphaproteobacteria bacterium]|nr:DUF1013 domain-containing protein [Alphaproteobacteria bacterium]
MSNGPLMPKATAVWLVDNTALTFDQIADFCSLHPLEVRAIADGDVAQGVRGQDPIQSGELTRESIEEAQNDDSIKLVLAKRKLVIPEAKTRKGPRYTPLSRRQDKPSSILWLVKFHPELVDSQVMKLVGTTKPTIKAIRERSHWNIQNIKPIDPVALGLCKQIELDAAVAKAAARVAKERDKAIAAGTLLPTEETTAPAYKKDNEHFAEIVGHVDDVVETEEATADNLFDLDEAKQAEAEAEEKAPSAADVFANFGND